MKKRASDQVVDYIQERIVSGEWTRGMKISTEVQLQQDTGFGKATVREAVEKLVAMGILKKRQGDGTYVSDFSAGTMMRGLMPELLLNRQDISAILEFREIIEPAGVGLFIEHFKEESVAELHRYLENMRQHQGDKDSNVFYESDRDFHLTIARGSQNTILKMVMEVLHMYMTKYHYTANRTIGAQTGVQEHEEILKAIERKDSELAALLMKRHIQRSKEDMKNYMDSHTDDFSE